MNTEDTEKSKQKLVEARAEDAALPQIIQENTDNRTKLLVLPRIACDSPSLERLLARPAALAGIFLGLGIFFGFLYSLVINPSELNFVNPIWLPLGLLLMLIAISKSTTRLADRFNCPALPELVAGALYPYGKILSALGLTLTEAHVWDHLADAAKQTGRFDDAAACMAKILTFEKPLESLYKLAENDYCWNLIFDGQIDRAIIYADQRLNYFRSMISESQFPKESALIDLAFTAHYAASVYESAGDLERASAIRQECFEKAKKGNGRHLSYNLSCLLKADLDFSQGDFASAATMYETYIENQTHHKTEFTIYGAPVKGRALMRLALCKAHQNEADEAKKLLSRAKRDIFKELSPGRRLEFELIKEEIEKIIAGQASDGGHLPIIDTTKIRSPRNNAGCPHHEEECSFSPGPVKILTKSSSMLMFMVAGSVPAIYVTLRHPTQGNLVFVAIALAITLALVAQKNKKLNKTRLLMKEQDGFPVTVTFNQLTISLTDRETGADLGVYSMNEHLHTVLQARTAKTFTATAYRDDKEIRAIEAFGYASDLSR